MVRIHTASGRSKRFTILPNIHPSFMHTFTHRQRGRARRATASWSGAGRVRHLAQGHLDTLGHARRSRDETSDLPVTSQRALPPEPHTCTPTSDSQTVLTRPRSTRHYNIHLDLFPIPVDVMASLVAGSILPRFYYRDSAKGLCKMEVGQSILCIYFLGPGDTDIALT